MAASLTHNRFTACRGHLSSRAGNKAGVAISWRTNSFVAHSEIGSFGALAMTVGVLPAGACQNVAIGCSAATAAFTYADGKYSC
jgi:hypothetical protein